MSSRFSKAIKRISANKAISELAICGENEAKGTCFSGFSGSFEGQPIDANSPYFLASATKLFVTAIILQLVESKELALNSPIVDFFPAGYLDKLHVIYGTDYTSRITVENLLAHTSGLADYFEQKQADGKTFSQGILVGEDKSFAFDDVIQLVKTTMKPDFVPGASNKAFYSDTNYQLLGAIIQNVTGVNFAQAVKARICDPLGLKNTWVFEANGPRADRPIIPLRNGTRQLNIPLAMTGTAADGAIVSTAADGLVFIKAFFAGTLFSPQYIDRITARWRRIFFPLQYGTGIMLFRLPPIMTLFQKQPDIIGHSGISGAFLFAEPENQIYISGTANQLASRSLPFNVMLRAIAAMR
ncbi:MAG TPA: class A beta-lactamase-related serine hydrolase [Devosia sp.]|nr:class A beta-lactamase-related serine hydrolase [Devosia sp.]